MGKKKRKINYKNLQKKAFLILINAILDKGVEGFIFLGKGITFK